GINSILTDHWRVYADVDAGFLGTHYQQNYLVSIGGRYAFGKKGLNTALRNPSGTKTPSFSNKQTNKIPAGYYLEVYSIPEKTALNPDQEKLLKNYPYVIEYTYKDVPNTQSTTNKVLFKNYLLGTFKTQQGALQNQKTANEVASILQGKNAIAPLKEIK
ncbi:hypothetical protein, partial [Helicobacter sp. 11S03491-1]|uniref:hypothetical protein n=1 Tax=Helicobacter sp. 11S03491-1 TaxID=1476196 RepID=UPI0015DB2645